MKKQSKGGNGNMLLLAGLGIGAFMLFANKSSAQSSVTNLSPAGNDAEGDIPSAPKILAVNSSDSESPLPTGIVSDEEGMESTSGSSGQSTSNYSSGEGDDSDNRTSISPTKNVPPLISTKLTTKEKAIIDKGVLSDDLAIKRPDLYKAIYIKKHGKKGNGQKALQAADMLIQSIQLKSNPRATSAQKKKRKVKIALSPNTTNMIMAAAQASAGAGVSAIALTAASQMQQRSAGKQAARKVPLHHAAGSKGTHPQKKAHHPIAKHPAQKRRVVPTHRKAAPHK